MPTSSGCTGQAFTADGPINLKNARFGEDQEALDPSCGCPVCATWTHTETTGSPEVTVVRPSALDEHSWVRPVVQIFTRSALPWALMATAFSYEGEFADTAPLRAAFTAAGIRPGR